MMARAAPMLKIVLHGGRSAARYGVRLARRWSPLVVPVAIFLAFLLSVGPSLQLYFVSLVGSDEPSVYGSAYSNALAPFPRLADWLIGAFDWRFLLIGGLAACCACRASTSRGQFAATATACFAGLCVLDVSEWVLLSPRALDQLLVSFGANLVGSAVAATLLLAVLSAHERALAVAGQAIRAAFLVLAGLAASIVVHYALLFFYKPLPIRVSLTASHPFSGGFAPHPRVPAVERLMVSSRRGSTRDGSGAFGLLPKRASGGKGEVNSPAGRLKVRWRRNRPDGSFVASLAFYIDCLGSDQVTKLGKVHGVTVSDVHALDLRFDAGQTFLEIPAQPRNGFSYDEPRPALVSTDVEKAGTTVTYFSAGRGRLRNVGPEEQVFFLNAVLIKSVEGDGIMVPRALRIVVNGIPRRVRFTSTGTIDPHAAMKCRALDLPAFGGSDPSGGVVRVAQSHLTSAGVLVRLTPVAQRSTTVLRTPVHSVEVSGGNGWFAVKGIAPDRMRNEYLGITDFLIVDQGVKQLSVDGARVDTVKSSRVVIMGDLSGSYDEEGDVHVEGSAQAAWLDGRRLNPTKWERLSNELRIFVLTTIVAAVAALGRLMARLLRRLADPAPLLHAEFVGGVSRPSGAY